MTATNERIVWRGRIFKPHKSPPQSIRTHFPFRSSRFAPRFFRHGGLRLPARLKGQALSLPCFLSDSRRNNATLRFLKNQSLKFQKSFRRPEIFFQQKFFQNLQTNSIFKPYIFFRPDTRFLFIKEVSTRLFSKKNLVFF